MSNTQVDWNYQIKNRPALGGFSYKGINPNAGPFSTSPLLIDQSTGFIVTDGNLALALVSLIRAGVIGIAGYQQVVGPLVGCTDNTSGPAPVGWGAGPSFICQDGTLAFYGTSEGATTGPAFWLGWSPASSPYPTGTMHSDGALAIESGGINGPMVIQNLSTGSYLEMDSLPNGTNIGDDISIKLVLAGSQAIFTVLPSAEGYDAIADISTGLSSTAAFSVQGTPGLTGTTLEGDDVLGGIIIGIGSGPITWPNITGSPGTTPHLLWTDGTGNLADTPNITTDGLGNLAFGNSAITTFTVPDGALLQFTSTTATQPIYMSFPGGGASASVQANVFSDQAGFLGFGPFFGGYRLDETMVIAWAHGGWYNTPNTSINWQAAGDVGVTDGAGGTTGAIIGISGAQLCLAALSTFAIFGATPAGQYNTPGQTGGFTPNTSANPVFNESTWDGNLGGTAYTIDDVVAALITFGFLAP